MIMTYINVVKKKGINYLYLVKDVRIKGIKVHLFQIYLGPESRIKNLEISSILKDHAKDVDLETMEFGISAALWQIAKEIDLVNIIDGIAGKSRQQGLTLGEYLTIAAINRCVKPSSKKKLGEWFEQDWIATQYAIEPKVLNAQTYWNHFQFLDGEKIREIERAITQNVVAKYNLGVDAVLYDSTNFFTFSKGGRGWKDGNGSELLMFGNSKENRNGNRIVAFWLLCERDTGVPLMHETYPGNRQDAGVFKGSDDDEGDSEADETRNEEPASKEPGDDEPVSVPALVVQRLQALGCDPRRVTMVFDNGNLSSEGIDAIETANLGFIASRRPSTHKDLLHHPLAEFTETVLPVTGKEIKYFRTTRTIYGKDWTVYVTFDTAKHDKDVVKFGAHLDAKVTEINEFFKDRLIYAPGEKRKGQGDKWRERSEVEQKLKSMIGSQPYKGVITAKVEGPDTILVDKGGQFKVHVTVDATARSNHEETLGRAVIFTSRADWTPESVIWGHREQYVVEHAFRHMKCHDSIAIRPMYHHADPCIRGHVFTCVMGLLLLSILRLTLKRKKAPASYRTILDALRHVQVTKIITAPKSVALLKLNRTQGFATRLCKLLELKRLVTF
jgi:transposase